MSVPFLLADSGDARNGSGLVDPYKKIIGIARAGFTALAA
jgi:hypothetical protein